MLKIISTIGFLVTLTLFLNSNITVEILFVINIFFIIIFFYNPVSALKTAQRVSSEVAETKFGKNDLQEFFINPKKRSEFINSMCLISVFMCVNNKINFFYFII